MGKRESDNGLTIIFSKELRRIRISTGTGTQKILTDSICDSIIQKIMIPEFKDNNYYSGIEKGLLQLIKDWK